MLSLCPWNTILPRAFCTKLRGKRGLGLILIITPPYLHRPWLLSTYLTACSMTPDMHLHTFTLHLSDASSSEFFHPCLSSSKVAIIYKHNNTELKIPEFACLFLDSLSTDCLTFAISLMMERSQLCLPISSSSSTTVSSNSSSPETQILIFLKQIPNKKL